jgi:putative acyl-CoA dehydrogenase
MTGAATFTRDTHDVINQSPAFVDVDLYTTDRALREAVKREGGPAVEAGLAAFGARCGSAEALDWGRLANENPPRLRTYDAKGHRLDIVEYHPAYHELMRVTIAQGQSAMVWQHLLRPGTTPKRGVNVARAAGTYLATQMEAGHLCPITMTHAAVPTLRLQPDIAAEWLPRVVSRHYDASHRPMADKVGVTIGMGMTEKQGGTDVRANMTIAEPIGVPGPGRAYRITGHKWFLSAPMCDAFLVLAQAAGGLSCFLVPRIVPDGAANALRFQRLKDKLGNRSNASSEVEFHGAWARLVADEGRGVPAIIEMVTETRLDCAVSSAGLMRFALATAIHHTRHRTVMQKKLIDHALMGEVLADMALDVEAATALAFRLARAFDEADDANGRAWRRLMTPVIKYWNCKMAPGLAYEAMECLGGNGYVEESTAARLYREAPLNAIWEGSGNVMALDVLRVLQREPDVAEIVMDEIAGATSGNAQLKEAFERLQTLLQSPRELDRRARSLVEMLALVAAGALLHAHAPAAVSEPFIATRLAGGFRATYGGGLAGAETRPILERALAS